MTSELTKVVSKILLEEINHQGWWCDTCKNDGFNGPCIDCKHKYSYWQLSKEKAEETSEEILRTIFTSEQFQKLL